MKLRADGLAIDIEITSRIVDRDVPEPYDDWLNCTVRLEVPAFSGVIRWNAQAVDFRRFRDQLMHLNENVGKPVRAELAGLEPGMKLSLVMMENGGIAGEYEFMDYGGLGADAPTLTGTFGLDQTFLPDMIRGVDAILSTKALGGRLDGPCGK